MPASIEIENIEQMRRLNGIDDVDLWEAIRRLRVGDLVRLTLVASTRSSETLPVRITSIRGAAFRGKLARKPASAGLVMLRVGSPLAFTAAHIHSLPAERPARGR